MVARGWACLHTTRLPVPKNLPAKPCVSITSKLIEIKRLQVLYSGHLRKTGGVGELPAGPCQRLSRPKKPTAKVPKPAPLARQPLHNPRGRRFGGGLAP